MGHILGVPNKSYEKDPIALFELFDWKLYYIIISFKSIKGLFFYETRQKNL